MRETIQIFTGILCCFAGVVLVIYFGPFWPMLGAMVFFVALFLYASRFRHRDFNRLLPRTRLSLDLSSGTLCVAGDFSFDNCEFIEAKPGRYSAELELDQDRKVISGIKLTSLSDDVAFCPTTLSLLTSGLMYLADSATASDAQLKKVVRRTVSGRLPAPVAESVVHNQHHFCIIIETGWGSGEYVISVRSGEVRSSFTGHDD